MKEYEDLIYVLTQVIDSADLDTQVYLQVLVDRMISEDIGNAVDDVLQGLDPISKALSDEDQYKYDDNRERFGEELLRRFAEVV